MASNHTDPFCMSTVIKTDFSLNTAEIMMSAQNRFQNSITSYERVRSNMKRKEKKKKKIKHHPEQKVFFQSTARFLSSLSPSSFSCLLHAPKYFRDYSNYLKQIKFVYKKLFLPKNMRDYYLSLLAQNLSKDSRCKWSALYLTSWLFIFMGTHY